MSLTNEQIARVFLLYWKSPFVYSGSLGVRRTMIGLTRGWNVIDDDDDGQSYRVEKCKLLLTPLSAISDEDAIEVAKIYHGLNKPMLLDYAGKQLVASLYEVEVEDYDPKAVTYGNYTKFTQIHQYLIQKGYAAPLFIEVGHPDNGKTAIELGLAISSNDAGNKK